MIRITQRQLDEAWEAAKLMPHGLITFEIPVRAEFKPMDIDPKNPYPKEVQFMHLKFRKPGMAIIGKLKAGYRWELMSEYELIK